MSDETNPITRAKVIETFEDQAKSINGTMIVEDEGVYSQIRITNPNGEYVITFSVEENNIRLSKLTNTGAGDGVSGELNEDIMTQVIQDIDEAEDQPDDSDDDDK